MSVANQIWSCSKDSYKSPSVPNFTKIRPAGAALIHAEGKTVGHEANECFSQPSLKIGN